MLAGSETWTRTLALELKRQGHEVECYSTILGVIAQQLKKEGVECYSEIPKKQYDAIISNHYEITKALRGAFSDTPIVSTIHGILHKLDKRILPEYPAAGAADLFVAVSEEVQKKLKDDYGLDSVIIRNFFEINPGHLNERPKKILFNSNYNKKTDPLVEAVWQVAQHYEAEFLALGELFYATPNIGAAIADSDIVFGIGRSVLEGVAQGKLGVVHGRWGTGGVVCQENIERLRWFNFSGRNNQDQWLSKDELISEIDKYYNQINAGWAVAYMRQNHNVVTAAQEYIKLCESLV